MAQPLVSIVTVNYKQPGVTCELLSSINQLKYKNLEVIVVDNESTVDNTKLFEKFLPSVIVMRSQENLGFAGGNNLALAKANGAYVLLLNNDTILPEGSLESLLEEMSHTGVAAISPVIKYYDQPDLIQYAGFTELNRFTGRNKLIKKPLKDRQSYETAYFHGAAVLIRKEVIEQLGYMPEGYFLYYEELAWGKAFRKAGYKVAVDPKSIVLHKESVSTGKDSPLKVFYQTRNRLAFMRRYGTSKEWLVFIIYFLSLGLIYKTFKYIIGWQGRHLTAMLKGVLAFFKIKKSELLLHF